MQAFCEGGQKVNAYVSTDVALSLRERDIYIRGAKKNAFIACLFKAELSEANTSIEHHFFLYHFLLCLFD